MFSDFCWGVPPRHPLQDVSHRRSSRTKTHQNSPATQVVPKKTCPFGSMVELQDLGCKILSFCLSCVVGGIPTPLNISQVGWLFPIYVKTKRCSKPPTSCPWRSINLDQFAELIRIRQTRVKKTASSTESSHRLGTPWVLLQLPYAATTPSVCCYPLNPLGPSPASNRRTESRATWTLEPLEIGILVVAGKLGSRNTESIVSKWIR